MTFTWLDWGFVAILAMCVLMGVARGLVREGLGLLVWIVALMVAKAFCVEAGNLVNGYVHIDNPLVRTIAGFVLVAFAVVVAGGFATRFLNAIVSWAGMGSFNRVLGGLFGAAKGAAIVALLGVVVPLTPVAQTPAWQDSALRPQVQMLKDQIQARYQQYTAQSSDATPASMQDKAVDSFDHLSQSARN